MLWRCAQFFKWPASICASDSVLPRVVVECSKTQSLNITHVDPVALNVVFCAFLDTSSSD